MWVWVRKYTIPNYTHPGQELICSLSIKNISLRQIENKKQSNKIVQIHIHSFQPKRFLIIGKHTYIQALLFLLLRFFFLRGYIGQDRSRWGILTQIMKPKVQRKRYAKIENRLIYHFDDWIFVASESRSLNTSRTLFITSILNNLYKNHLVQTILEIV